MREKSITCVAQKKVQEDGDEKRKFIDTSVSAGPEYGSSKRLTPMLVR